MGFEPTAPSLRDWCSTTELKRHPATGHMLHYLARLMETPGIEPRVSRMPGKRSTTELHPNLFPPQIMFCERDFRTADMSYAFLGYLLKWDILSSSCFLDWSVSITNAWTYWISELKNSYFHWELAGLLITDYSLAATSFPGESSPTSYKSLPDCQIIWDYHHTYQEKLTFLEFMLQATVSM